MPAPDDDSTYNPNALARDLMMPTGEPAAAVIAALALLGMVWFAGSGHLPSATHAPAQSAAAAQPSLQPSNLQSRGGPIASPASRRTAG
ncbi:MAG TPA: hypothetical protein VHX43_10705 [Xanthobacteraceae bacterium]|jgi:hypothetical protein|nr:hypothetical protein [Xanthobacteraceae bacterium]